VAILQTPSGLRAPYLASFVQEGRPSSLPVGVDPRLLSWQAQSASYYSGRPIAGGLSLELPFSGEANAYGPVDGEVASNIRVDGDVRFASGSAGNALGLGCEGVDRASTYWFFIHDVGTWSFDTLPENPNAEVTLLARGDTSTIGPTTAVNRLAVTCTVDGAAERFELAINGTPVANLVVKVAATPWYPIAASCSPDGPDTADFTDVRESLVG